MLLLHRKTRQATLQLCYRYISTCVSVAIESDVRVYYRAKNIVGFFYMCFCCHWIIIQLTCANGHVQTSDLNEEFMGLTFLMWSSNQPPSRGPVKHCWVDLPIIVAAIKGKITYREDPANILIIYLHQSYEYSHISTDLIQPLLFCRRRASNLTLKGNVSNWIIWTSLANRTMSSPSSQPPQAFHPVHSRVMQPTLTEDAHIHHHEQHQTMYPPPRMPEVVNRPRLYTEFQGSDLQYGFNPGMNNMPTQAAYHHHPSEYVYPEQEMKRRKFSNDSNSTMMHEPNVHYYPNDREVNAPYYPPQQSEYGYQQLLDNGSSRPLMPIESRNDESNSVASLSEDHPRLLWLPEDQQHLTELHCFVRKRCVFIFSATSHDVDSKSVDY